MKKHKFISIAALTALFCVVSCKQEVITLQPPPGPTTPPTPTKGSADFTKFVSVGTSFVAGMQGQALFNTGQANSLPAIMAKQFVSVGGPATFNQPDIGSVNGFNPILSNPGAGLILGRLILFDPDGPTGPRSPGPAAAKMPATSVTCPSAVSTPAVPAPYNTADAPGAFTGNKAALNNFAVPLILLGQTLTPLTGGPPSATPPYTPFYARFASVPGTSTIIGDAKAAAGSFYLIWLGFDDVLLYAATGADGATAGTFPMTAAASFSGQFGAAITTLLTGTTFKGVVGNIPDFTSLPYFYTVPWNTITLDAATVTSLSTLSTNYNGFLDQITLAGVITAAERDKRKLNYVVGKNGVLMSDETLTDLSSFMTGPAAALLPYKQARQAVATDLVPLATGSILGTCNGGNPQAVWGVSFPVADKDMLIATETQAILTRTAEFNTAISAAVAGSGGRLVVADIRAGLNAFVAAKAFVADGVMITPSFAPPTATWSEDGLHFNNRGNAFVGNMFIDAINAGFGATLPKASLAVYTATGLPVSP